MKKRFKVIAVIVSTCVITMTTALSVFADGASAGGGPFTKVWDGYYCPDVIAFSQPMETYPEGIESAVGGYTVAVSSKIQYSEAVYDINNWIDPHTWDVLKYVEIKPQYNAGDGVPDEYADLSTWNRVMTLQERKVQYYSTFSGTVVNSYIDGLPIIDLKYDDVIYANEYHSKYNYMTYMRVKTNHATGYNVVVTGDISTFNNVTGEMSYVNGVSYSTYITPTESNGVYTAEFKLLYYLKQLADYGSEVNLSHLQNVNIRIVPTSTDGEVQEVAFSSPVKTDNWYTIQDVWNTENEAFNWWNFTDWITIAINGFLAFELMPGISLIGIVGALVGLSVFIYFLKVFAGG